MLLLPVTITSPVQQKPCNNTTHLPQLSLAQSFSLLLVWFISIRCHGAITSYQEHWFARFHSGLILLG
jgi:hypothetical protein